jgi:uncharacterized membrane protein
MQYNGILFAIIYFVDSVSSFCVKNTNKLIKHYISGAGLVLILEVQVLNRKTMDKLHKKK